MRGRLGIAVTAVGVAVGARAGPVDRGQAEQTFFPALFEAGQYVTQPMDGVDWEQATRRHFTRFDPFALDSAGLAEIRSRTTEYGVVFLEYDAPLPAGLAEGHYYVATPAGLEPLEPVGLRGTVRFDVDDDGRPRTGPEFFGSLVLRPEGTTPGAGGGFVFRRTTPLPAGTIEEARRSRAAFLARALPPEPDSANGAAWLERVVGEYSFTLVPGSPPYLFRRLAHDRYCHEACCEHRYRLLRSGQPVAALDAGCDV